MPTQEHSADASCGAFLCRAFLCRRLRRNIQPIPHAAPSFADVFAGTFSRFLLPRRPLPMPSPERFGNKLHVLPGNRFHPGQNPLPPNGNIHGKSHPKRLRHPAPDPPMRPMLRMSGLTGSPTPDNGIRADMPVFQPMLDWQLFFSVLTALTGYFDLQ
ncbi:MAG: hypothetical protein LBR80_17810 [Deltaproteobacteria bacterium]|nr:hypothetical protein [Deltaproteobacteria bacterium]